MERENAMISPRAISALVIAGACVLSALAGWTVQGWRADARQLASVRNAISQAEEIARQDDAVATRFETEKTRIVTVFQTIEEKQNHDAAENPDYRICRLSPAGVVLWNAVNAGRLPADPGKPDDAMRAGGLAPHWEFGGTDPQPSPGNAGIPPQMPATGGPASAGQSAEVAGS
jgi:hypothetical protein